MSQQLPSGAPPRALIFVAVLVGLVLAIAVAAIGLSQNSAQNSAQNDEEPVGPLALVAVDAPEADSSACVQLVAALPAELPSAGTSLARRQLAEPAPRAAAGWGAPEAVVLRCGLRKPGELRQDSRLQVINGVQWLPVAGADSTTFFTVDRDVFVALTVPATAGTGPVQAVSEVVSASLRPLPPRF